MSWTAKQVRHAALEHLGIVGAGQAAHEEDDDLAERAYKSLYARLFRKKHAPFLRDAVPDGAFFPLAKLVGDELLDAFGFTGPRRTNLENSARRAMRELQEETALKGATFEAVGIDY